jgi:hypothetical protein
MVRDVLDPQVVGWWRIVDTSQWGRKTLDRLGTAMLSITGGVDQLRMHFLLATVKAKPLKSGATFTWEGAWEFDELHGTGRVKLRKDGTLEGHLQIARGDRSAFSAERTLAPAQPIPDPPSYADKWIRYR